MSTISPEGFVVLRTPLLPLEAWRNWTMVAADMDDASRAKSLAGCMTPEFRDGLFISSPSLFDGLDRMVSEPESKKGKGAGAATCAMLARAASRCTPLGAFAGLTMGRAADSSKIRLAPRAAYKKKVVLDLRWVIAACRWLEQQPEIREQLKFSVNSTLWRFDSRFRFLEEFQKPSCCRWAASSRTCVRST